MSKNLKIKVCGMRFASNRQALEDLPIDILGFIFHAPSPRNVELLTPGEIKFLTATSKGKAGVFVDRQLNDMLNIAKQFGFSHIQLHGSESPEYCKAVRSAGLQVIKVFHIDENFDFSETLPFEGVADYFLFDRKKSKQGGSGIRFNWKILEKYKQNVPFFLSGGICPENTEEISQLNHPALIGLDLNSGFEDAPGYKNYEKLKTFFEKLFTMKYTVNEKGYYGEFGGAWIPEMMYANINELQTRYIDIIQSVEFRQEFDLLMKDYVGRPSPLYYAKRLSQRYNSHIYLKREDLNHTGSHKLNNTVGQILLAQKLGKTRIIAETGAGQHGLATATVCALKGLKCIIYMGALDVKRQEPNVKKMKMLGAEVVPVYSGNKTLKDATNEAMRDWINNPEDTHYIIGSVVGPHPYPDMVARFQSVISAEMKQQLLQKTGSENPTRIIACVGGGSNAAGAYYHYLDEPEVELIGVEAAGKGIETDETAATLAVGSPGVLHAAKTILMQSRDGQITEPYSISAGLDYPGIGPLHAHLFKTGRARYLSATDKETLDAALLLTQTEGIIPALESAHALAALEKIQLNPNDVSVICLSGRGDKDMQTYLDYFGY